MTHGGMDDASDEGVMDEGDPMEVPYGTPVGHYLAGSLLLLFTLHWSLSAWRLILIDDPRPTRASYPLCGSAGLEPALRFVAILLGYAFELYIWEDVVFDRPDIRELWHPMRAPDGVHFQYIDAWTHCTMYTGFGLAALAELVAPPGRVGSATAKRVVRAAPLAFISLGFAVTSMLHIFHSLGQTPFFARIHAFVALFAFGAAASSLCEAMTLPVAAPGATLARIAWTMSMGMWELRAGGIIATLDSWRGTDAKLALPIYASWTAFNSCMILGAVGVVQAVRLRRCSREGQEHRSVAIEDQDQEQEAGVEAHDAARSQEASAEAKGLISR
jgi:hypothetical protein